MICPAAGFCRCPRAVRPREDRVQNARTALSARIRELWARPFLEAEYSIPFSSSKVQQRFRDGAWTEAAPSCKIDFAGVPGTKSRYEWRRGDAHVSVRNAREAKDERRTASGPMIVAVRPPVPSLMTRHRRQRVSGQSDNLISG